VTQARFACQKLGHRDQRSEPKQRVVVQIGERFLAGWSYTKIANHLNRPCGPPSPKKLDSKRNTAGKWSKTTIRCILINPVYTGRLYWNRLGYSQLKAGEGPVVKRPEEEWIEAEARHEAIISDETFQRIAWELDKRRTTEGSRRRMAQRRDYPLRGILHCATGHNPLSMHGKDSRGTTYYACSYWIAYGDEAAVAIGHGKWQYVREDVVMPEIDRFFANNIFGPDRIEQLCAQYDTVTRSIATEDSSEQDTLRKRVGDVEHRIQMQVQAIEAGVEPSLVSARIEQLKQERLDLQRALAASEGPTGRRQPQTDLDAGCEILDQLPILDDELANADPALRRKVFDVFQLAVEIDKQASATTEGARVQCLQRGGAGGGCS
jgi:site-specific DNA recombinase